MSQVILSNVKLWVAGYDMSGKLNAIAISDDPDILDSTVFGNTAKNRKKGLDVVTAALAGFWEAPISDEYFSTLGVPLIQMTVTPVPTEGGPAYSFLSQNVEYSMGGSIGEMFKFNVKAESVGQKMIRGKILLNAIKTGSGTGTPFEMTTIGPTQRMYAALHVVSVPAADTLDVIIQSDALVGFTTPSDRIIFAQKAAIGYEWKTLGGSDKVIAFTGGGAYEILPGDIITGDTGGATAEVVAIEITGGDWATEDAAGNLYLKDQDGAFEAEDLNVGANEDVATIGGDSSAFTDSWWAINYTLGGAGPFEFCVFAGIC